MAAGARLSAIALTDHDTQAGVAAAVEAGQRHGVRVISGLELSCGWPMGAFHLLVYFLPIGSGPIAERLNQIQAGRAHRNRLMVEKLQALGIDIELEEVATESRGGMVGRPHFAAVLVKKGVVGSLGEAFDLYLGDGGPAYQPRFRLGAKETIALARASGGVPVLAHPHTLGLESRELREQLAGLTAAGLAGLECFYGEYLPEVRTHLAGLARSLGLVPTGGSDHHGTYKPDSRIGIGRGDLVVADDLLAELDALS